MRPYSCLPSSVALRTLYEAAQVATQIGQILPYLLLTAICLQYTVNNQ